MTNKIYYISLNRLVESLKLPKRFIENLANEKRIPCLKINGRYRFNLEAVQKALTDIAAKGGQDATK